MYTQEEVNYRPAAPGVKRRCEVCIRFREDACTVVKGKIQPQWVCNLWKLKVPADRAA
jgi:hypothetical protein